MSRADRILVTGAAGFVGGHLAVELAHGHRVSALDPRRCAPRVTAAVDEVLLAEAGDDAVLAAVATGRYDAVVHQGAITDTLCEDAAALHEANVGQSLRLADACARSDTAFVYASSNAVYGAVRIHRPTPEDAVDDTELCSGPLNEYGRTKLELDRQLADRDDLRWVGLRFTNVFGTHELTKGRMASIIGQWLRAAARKEPLTVFADTLLASRDYVPVGHVVATISALLDDLPNSGVYNLGSGVPISFAKLLEWCVAFVGGPVAVLLVPNPVRARYQYWTCADLGRLHAQLPDLPRLSPDDVRTAAAALFEHYRTKADELERAKADL